MKKVTLAINGYTDKEAVNNISGALNDLSGVVAADVAPAQNKAYAYSGDRLNKEILEGAVRKAGYEAKVIDEQYLNDVNDYKNSLQ